MSKHFLSKFVCLSSEKKVLFIEALYCLTLSRLALKVLPFRMIQRFMNRLPAQPEVRGDDRIRIREDVIWAISRASRFLPGKTVCFPQGITAQEMLRRRRIGTVLYYGATTKLYNGLTGHVWVKDGSHGVIGCEIASDYKLLAFYPKNK